MSDATPIAVCVPSQLGPRPRDWRLGSVSERYETGGRGPGTVSRGTGDAGGVSYGSYQMKSRPNGGVVAAFLKDPVAARWRTRFAHLEPGTPAFSHVWQEIAATTPDAFRRAQHHYIARTHFMPQVRAARRLGIELTTRSAALADAVWSAAVQVGPHNRLLARAVAAVRAAGGDVNDDALLIRALYAERGRRAANGSLALFSHNSAAVQAGVAKRFEREERDALTLLDRQCIPLPPLAGQVLP